MSRPSWAWLLFDAEDGPLDRPLSPTFTNRFDAESWLGETWRDLATQDVARVRLAQDGDVIGDTVELRRG
ncbi:hypothetical protein [Actinotalea sp. K2]|uniref:hypothetical protein n=1 Tax=Actinotalea sp. K2 TaxID=2939438 RepID=UPI002017B0B7|nr:hypothetical protein [Actinotalea sp. K2]MCL3860722.1 hypothetical protein [Actinotalea sp. K2]